jgi:very-short-patch-repair endonuclease
MRTATSTTPTFDPRHPFSRADARAAGMALSELLGSRYKRILYDSYVLAAVPVTWRLRAEAALSASGPGAYASHQTAALLWGGTVPEPSEVHITVPAGMHRSRRQGVSAHEGDFRPAPVSFRGIALSSPAQTFIDLAEYLNLVDLVVLGDSLVKACRVSVMDLVAATAAWSGRGVRRARRAARLVRDGVDSPMETRLRLLLVLAGLPEPQVNFVLRHPDGSWWMRYDLYYQYERLLVEFDGRQHAESSIQWHHDIQRREELDRRGLRLIVVTAEDLYQRPEQLLKRVREALADRGATGLRPKLKPEWRRHFQQRPVESHRAVQEVRS